MNYINPSISITPLREWKSINISYDDKIHTIPSGRMLAELITMPVPDLTLIVDILKHYGVTEEQRKEIKKIIENANYDEKNWLLNIVEKLVADNYDSKLILRLSLENYRLQQPFDINSHLILKKMSDVTIKNIRIEDVRSSPIDRIIKSFLDKKEISNLEFLNNLSSRDAVDYTYKYFIEDGDDLSQINYRRFRYHKLVLNYFDDIAPFRIAHMPNIDKDRIVNYFLQDFYQQMQDVDNSKVFNSKIPLNKSQQEYHERINDSHRRKMILFTDYYNAKIYISKIYKLLSQECPDFIALQIDWNDKVQNSNRLKHNRKNMKRKMLCLCEFCYKFRWFQKAGNGSVAWHCQETECKERYRDWLNYIRSKNIVITSYLR